MSNNLRESQATDMFVAEYALPNHQTSIRIKDSIKINIQECYLEHRWAHEKYWGRSPIKGYQLTLIGNISPNKSFPLAWTAGTDTTDGRTWWRACAKDCMVMDLAEDNQDTLRFLVFTSTEYPKESRTILGSFMLIKKKLCYKSVEGM